MGRTTKNYCGKYDKVTVKTERKAVCIMGNLFCNTQVNNQKH